MISLYDRITPEVEKAFIKALETDLKGDTILNIKKILQRKELPEIQEIALLKPSHLAELTKREGITFADEESKPFKNAYTEKWSSKSKANLLSLMGIDTCPYCNRNFILNVYKDENEGRKGMLRECHFDHFHNKDDFPHLALALYNLIPCCASCNGIKSKQEFETPNPYSDEFDWTNDLRLGYRLGLSCKLPKSDEQAVDEEDECQKRRCKEGENPKLAWKVQFQLRKQEEKRTNEVNSFLDTLKLCERYEHHEGIIADIMKRQMVYNDSYQEELYRKYAGRLFSSRAELKSMLFGRPMSDYELHTQPLSKLRRDIEDQMNGYLDDFIPLGR